MLVLIRQQSFSHNSHSLHSVPLIGVEPRHLLLLQQCIAHSRESHLADLRLAKESCYCVMMCLYLCGYISEVIAMNQYISFCNYGDVEMMMKSNDINDACIQAGNSGSTHSQFYSDIPLLQLLIHLYSERRVVSNEASHVGTL